MQWLTLKRLRSKDHDTRVKAFAEATQSRDIGALLQVIGDADQYLRDDAIKALGEIGDAGAVPALIGRLDDPNFNNQEDAAAALAKIGDMRAVRPLAAMLRAPNKHYQARQAAAKALIALGDARAISDLLDALGDPDEQTRSLSLKVMGSIGDGRCVPAAIAALHDPSSNVRWGAVETLGSLRDARAVEALLDLLTHAGLEAGGPSRECIVEALGKINDRRAMPALLALLNGPQESLRNAAATALKALGWQPADTAERVRYCMAMGLWDEIARLGWDTVRQPLMESLQNGDSNIRTSAVRALCMIGTQNVVGPLVQALIYENVAGAAAVELGKIGDARAIQPLIAHSMRYSPEGGYRNDPGAPYREQTRAAQWVKPLEELVKRTASEIAPEELRDLAGLRDETYYLRVEYDTPGYGDGADDFTVKRDFSRVREFAVKELGRRGLDI